MPISPRWSRIPFHAAAPTSPMWSMNDCQIRLARPLRSMWMSMFCAGGAGGGGCSWAKGSPTLAWGPEAPVAVWSGPPSFGWFYKVWPNRVMTAAMWRART
jgi:hypothetical protein